MYLAVRGVVCVPVCLYMLVLMVLMVLMVASGAVLTACLGLL
jgi:hypothetical protein